ncbi:hypothetical protein TPHA_0A03870 [Tetrapisispora phaffii CBS 4417]|uniref:Endoplasmic reticulum lectin n=1 Tax=Tetrapisispora phaffii (strain ATCC 24235 / CBS 4417 / NBRC 1672 / NRRL Y-8282 / UCD 70-5) TaxID=1071381 RepID=G8BNI5_TETPH|nr:hypothetical protein TPHA_0A03870 [Tetrapisispora phaffii CBS 4417]CCE61463.1 hypothetical protein TPHA_0A03870 [Tetrapisispora phaffii CBS 4417]
MRLLPYLFCTLIAGLCSGLFMPLEDPLLLNKYSINYISLQAWEKSILSNETALTEGSIHDMGDSLKCYIPDSSNYNPSEEIAERNETELNKIMADNLEKGVKIIQETLTSCIIHPNGFWNYKYCPGDSLVQYHANSGSDHLLAYNLGRSPKRIQDRQYQLLYNEYGYYIGEFLDDGEYCEVTGYPRMTEIQYTCGPSNGPANFQWARETKTCVYEARINIPELCDLELLSLNDDKKTARPVICVKDFNINTSSSNATDADGSSSLNPGVINVLSAYDPTFLGYSFYLLTPKSAVINSEIKNRNLLMYTGAVSKYASLDELYAVLYQKASNAVSRMMFMKYLLLPDNKPFKEGDEFTWVADLVNMEGNRVYTLTFHINERLLVDIQKTEGVQFPEIGNFISYKRKGGKLIRLPRENKAPTANPIKKITSSQESHIVEEERNADETNNSVKVESSVKTQGFDKVITAEKKELINSDNQDVTSMNKKVNSIKSNSVSDLTIKSTTTIITTSVLASEFSSKEKSIDSTDKVNKIKNENIHKINDREKKPNKLESKNVKSELNTSKKPIENEINNKPTKTNENSNFVSLQNSHKSQATKDLGKEVTPASIISKSEAKKTTLASTQSKESDYTVHNVDSTIVHDEL